MKLKGKISKVDTRNKILIKRNKLQLSFCVKVFGGWGYLNDRG